eukprot:2506581-Rhodomonas_salina.5
MGLSVSHATSGSDAAYGGSAEHARESRGSEPPGYRPGITICATLSPVLAPHSQYWHRIPSTDTAYGSNLYGGQIRHQPTHSRNRIYICETVTERMVVPDRGVWDAKGQVRVANPPFMPHANSTILTRPVWSCAFEMHDVGC